MGRLTQRLILIEQKVSLRSHKNMKSKDLREKNGLII